MTKTTVSVSLSAVVSVAVCFAAEPDPSVPELKVLQRYVGTWNGKAVTKQAVWTSNEIRSEGTSTKRWIVGGRLVESKGTTDDGKIENLQLYTYDVVRKQYRSWFFDSLGYATQWSGDWDESSMTMTWKADLGGVPATAIHVLEKNKIEWSIVAKDANGKVYLDIKGTSTSKK